MANILQTISKEVEKGNTFLTESGNFISQDKIDVKLKKDYLAGLKDGSINFEKSFDDFRTEEMEKYYVPVSSLERVISDFFRPELSEDTEAKEK